MYGFYELISSGMYLLMPHETRRHPVCYVHSSLKPRGKYLQFISYVYPFETTKSG
jgi:hypothetical protein